MVTPPPPWAAVPIPNHYFRGEMSPNTPPEPPLAQLEAITSCTICSPLLCVSVLTQVHGQGGFKFQNWAKTYGSSPELYFQPTSVEEIREILDMARQRNKRVKVVGGGHSPSDIACTDDFMIQMGKMNKVLKVDKEKQQVTVEGGIFLSDLNVELSKHGLALANLGAVSEVAAAGVIGTGTHNTGIKHGILPTQVVGLSLLTASGDILECSESINADIFQAARLHLGCLGVVLTVTFQCVPQFHLHEVTFPSTLTEVLNHLDDHLKRSQYFRFLWFPHSENVTVIYQDPTNKPPSSSANWFWDYAVGYYLLEFLLWISTFVPSLVCWINRFFFWLLFSSRVENINVSYKIFNYECRFKQHVQDWAIPIEKTKEALLELKAALENNPKMVAHYPVEVRFARADEIWLSPCFQRDSCYMNIIMYRPYGKNVPRLNYWLTYEGIMKKYGGRPHWAKAHSCTRKDFEKMYPAFPKFCSVRDKLDPTGMFLNTYLEKVFY
uniref:L-gulonolactone oxidase n=1 Tax=Gallus gallus TaxID=9031 RepID=A0A8V0YBQ3_CHICK